MAREADGFGFTRKRTSVGLEPKEELRAKAAPEQNQFGLLLRCELCKNHTLINASFVVIYLHTENRSNIFTQYLHFSVLMQHSTRSIPVITGKLTLKRGTH